MGCLQITAARSDVGQLYFEWELAIPVVTWLIIPYVSIDAFFLAAPFLASDHRELGLIADRLALAPLIAASIFLLVPLELGYNPQTTEGLFAPVFQFLAASQEPHNLLPSLHVTYTVILRQVYHRHTRGWLNTAVHLWLALVTASTVLTHQHHLIDVAGGAAVGTLILYLVPAAGSSPVYWPQRVRPYSARLGLWYGSGALACLALVPTLWPWGILFAWAGLALAFVSAGYLGLGPVVFQKHGGQLVWPARLVLGPYLLGLWLSRCYYRSRIPSYKRVAPGVLAGRQLTVSEAQSAIEQEGITAVLDLTAEHSETPQLLRLNYHNIQILDLVAPSDAEKAQAQRFIREHAEDGLVYVHCALGRGRTNAVIHNLEATDG